MMFEYIFQIFVSGINIGVMMMAGDKHKHTWLWSLLVQLLWLILIIWQKLWGILPFNLFMWYISIRNHYKWKKDL